jgi:ribosomal protein S18 acetylase RimI-like enzyme
MTAPLEPALVIEPLGSHHKRSGFSSGVEALDSYLHRQARQDVRKHVAATFALAQADNFQVLGFYSLSATSIRLSDLPESVQMKLPKYPVVPAILLGRLAVDRDQRGKGYGELLLMDALKRSLQTRDIGWAVVVVDAKDENAKAFYEKFQFTGFSKDSRRLFLFRKTIETIW